METEILLNITEENMAEAEFMSANFIDEEIKKRAFINTLGAEAGITYLDNNGINTEDIRNLHSIKRILEKTNIADIILPNIHIDVRVVFDKEMIFVPKSHAELGIEPDIYMVLKFNQNFKDMEFLGYFTPDIINKENANDEYYFVDASEIKSGTDFIDFVKNFDGNTDNTLSEYDILKGRELAVLASDEDITTDEYREFIQLLKSSVTLRDSVLEYDNFETLAGSVAHYMLSSNYHQEQTEDNTSQELTATEELDMTGLNLSLEQDPNGDSLIDDDITAFSGLEATDMVTAEPDIADNDKSEQEITDSAISDEAIQLAGMSGDIEQDEPATTEPEGLDIGTADFNLDEQEDKIDNMDIDLFDSIDTSGTDFNDSSSMMSTLESDFSQSADDIEFNQMDFGDSSSTKEEDKQEFETISEQEEITETEPEQPETLEISEELLTDNETDDLAGTVPELEELEISADDLSEADENENDMFSEQEEDMLELPTEGATDFSNEELSLETDDILTNDLNINEEDLLSFDEDSQEDAPSLAIEDTEEESEGKEEKIETIDSNNDNELIELKDDNNILPFEPENTEIVSFEEYNPIEDNNSGNLGVTKTETENETAESIDFSDLKTTNEQTVDEPETTEENSEIDLLDFASMTEESNSDEDAKNINIEDVDRTDASQTDEFEEFESFEDISEGNAEISGNSEEIIITDEFLNNSVVTENSTIISDKDFEPGEILLDINRTSLPDFENDELGDLYNNENTQSSGLNNGVRIGALKDLNFSSIPPKYGIAGLLLIIIVAGVILFSVNKSMGTKEEPTPVTGSLNPANKIKDNTVNKENIDPDNIVMNDENGSQNVRRKKRQAEQEQPQAPEIQNRPPKPIPATSFLSVKKMSWEVPDYVSYSAEFRQFFQSSGKSLKTALNSDLLLATDYTYSNVIKLSITFDKSGKFKDAKIITSSGSDNVDKIVLQSVNQTLNILKAPNSVDNNESTTVILKIYL